MRTYLESRRKEMRKVDLDVATFICVSAIEAVAHNTVLHGAEMLSEKTVRTLVEETTRLVVGVFEVEGVNAQRLRCICIVSCIGFPTH